MNKHNLKALIFDLDGVIADSELLQFDAMQELLKNYGISIKAEEMIKSFAGRTDEQILIQILKDFGKGDLNVKKLVEERTEIYLGLARKKLLPVKGAIECVKEFSRHFKKLAVTTSSNVNILNLVLDKFKIREYFQALVCSDDIEHSKPHPDPYLKTMAKMGFSANECAVIEDSVVGINSAKAADCMVLGITTTFPAEDLRRAGVNETFENFEEIRKFLI